MPYTCHRVAALPFMPLAQCPECVDRASRPYIDTYGRGVQTSRGVLKVPDRLSWPIAITISRDSRFPETPHGLV